MGNKVSEIYEDDEHVGYVFRNCKCGMNHKINTKKPNRNGAIWSFNGDLERPTFSPSILSTVEYGVTSAEKLVCHFFIKDGKIEYLSDCTHGFAGQTVDMWDFESEE